MTDAASENAALLSVRNLEIIEIDHKRSLLQIDEFDLAPAEIVGVVGPSGAGKSLFALSLLGLVHEQGVQVKSGIVQFSQVNMLSAPGSELDKIRGREISLIYQDPLAALDPAARTYLQLLEPLRNTDLTGPEAEERIGAVLEMSGLPPTNRVLHSMPTRQLSGGERQRVLLSMAMAAQPTVLVADEPTTAMDPINKLNFVRALHELRNQRGLSVVLISHDTDLVEAAADRVVTIRNGRMEEAELGNRSYSKIANRPLPKKEQGNALISFHNVSKTYSKGVDTHKSVDGVSFNLLPGEVLGLIGASGSGKTTTARLALGLETQDAGEIINNVPRGKMQMVFQDPGASLDPLISIGRSIAEPLIVSGVPVSNALKQAATMMETVGLAAISPERLPRELSGGQRQRVCIARALAAAPMFLLADEPTTALDKAAARSIFELLNQMRERKPDMSMIIISHDLSAIGHFCDRIAVLDRGQMVEEGVANQVLTKPVSEAAKKLVTAWRKVCSSENSNY